MFETLIAEFEGNPIVKLTCLSIVGDTIFGVLRALMQREFNSSFGINGGIRKIGIICGMLMLLVADMVVNINLTPFINGDCLAILGISNIGLVEFFGALFISYEFISILKNMAILGLPMPRNMRNKLEKWLKQNTDEMGEDDGSKRN